MSTDDKYQGYEQVPTDHTRTALISTAIVLVILLAAAIFHAPYVAPVSIAQLAQNDPVAFISDAESQLAATSDTAQYGPPYTFDTAKTYVIEPLQRFYAANASLDHSALDQYLAATDDQRAAWNKNYSDALANATVVGGKVQVAAGDYGPVPAMLEQLRQIAAQGWLDTTPSDISTESLLFLGDSGVLDDMAQARNMLDVQWGMIHEENPHYPGAWWLTPVSAMYNTIFKNDDNADLHVAMVLGVAMLVGLFWPFLPGLRSLPRHLRVYRVIWRDYYRSVS